MTPGLVRVLVVDDDAMQLELVERALGRSGNFDVRGAATLDEMERAAKDFAPQVVLVDVNMPDLSEGEAVAAARTAAPGAKIVLYSAWEESRLRGIAARVGADGFLSKSESVLAIAKKLGELA